MDEQKVRNYLLCAVVPNEGYSLGKYLRRNSRGCFSGILVSFGVAFVAGVLADYANIVTITAFGLIVLAIPIVAALTIRRFKMIVANLEVDESCDSEKKISRTAVGGTALGICGGVVGMFIANHFLADVSQTAIISIVISGAALINIVCTFCFCMFAYQLHLLKKYCPDLIDYKPGSF